MVTRRRRPHPVVRETLEALRLWVDSELQRLIGHPWSDVQPLVSGSLDESGVDWSFFARPEADRLLGRREDLRTPQPWLVARIGALLELAERDPASAPMISVLARIEWRDCENAPLRVTHRTRSGGADKTNEKKTPRYRKRRAALLRLFRSKTGGGGRDYDRRESSVAYEAVRKAAGVATIKAARAIIAQARKEERNAASR